MLYFIFGIVQLLFYDSVRITIRAFLFVTKTYLPALLTDPEQTIPGDRW